jgi:hypothetical protein
MGQGTSRQGSIQAIRAIQEKQGSINNIPSLSGISMQMNHDPTTPVPMTLPKDLDGVPKKF